MGISALLLFGCAGAPARHSPAHVTRVPKWSHGAPTPPAPTRTEPRSYFATDDWLNRESTPPRIYSSPTLARPWDPFSLAVPNGRPIDDAFDELALEAEAAKHVAKAELSGVRRSEHCVDANEKDVLTAIRAARAIAQDGANLAPQVEKNFRARELYDDAIRSLRDRCALDARGSVASALLDELLPIIRKAAQRAYGAPFVIDQGNVVFVMTRQHAALRLSDLIAEAAVSSAKVVIDARRPAWSAIFQSPL